MNYLDIPAELRVPAERMFRITGFVTALCPPADQRPLAFARFYHVRRVAWTCQLLCARRGRAGIHDDLAKVHWLSWAHDLNRWPFAQNSEKGLFDQGADVRRFFAANATPLAEALAVDLQGIIDKDPTHLSDEGKVVLLADIITGFVEDPLWTVTALDLRPSFVPDCIAEYLCLELKRAELQHELLEMNRLFAATRAVEPFESRFDQLFQRVMTVFVDRRDLALRVPLGEPEFEGWRLRVKEDFMRKHIFRYNNDKISKGALLRSVLVEPLHGRLAGRAVEVLTTIDEPGMLALCVGEGVIEAADADRFLPDLDYVSAHEPDNSFGMLGNIELEAT